MHQQPMGVDLDSLMHKFNNSLAIQNIGQYSGGQNGVLASGNSKSRNMQANTFKTTASMGTASRNIKQTLT